MVSLYTRYRTKEFCLYIFTLIPGPFYEIEKIIKYSIVSYHDINVLALECAKLVKLKFVYPYPSSSNTSTDHLL